jgi:diguanylate cyclase (GGDEF)-like protein
MLQRLSIFKFLDHLSSWPKPLLFAMFTVFTLLIGLYDYLTHEQAAVSVLYFPLISIACWVVGFRSAITLSLLACLLWILDDLAMPNRPWPKAFKYWQTAMNFLVYVAFAYMLAKLKTTMQWQHRISRSDELTGLSNRVALFDDGRRDLVRCRRNGRPLTAVFIDLDEFKQVNDLYGHAEGDKVLRTAANCLRLNTRESDLTARIGGDEFVVLAPEMSYEAAQRYAERLQRCFLAEMSRQGWPVTVSLGVATFNSPPGTVDELVKEADALMYAAKRLQKNSIKHCLVDSERRSRDEESAQEACAI